MEPCGSTALPESGREATSRKSRAFPESFEIHPRPWLEGVKPILAGTSTGRPGPKEKSTMWASPWPSLSPRDRHIAEDAVDEIVVEYEALPVVADPWRR